MSRGRERSHLVDMHSHMPDNDDQILFSTLLEHNNQQSPLDDAPSSPLCAEADPLETLSSYDFGLNGNWETGEHLGESLESLDINGNDGFNNSEISDSSFGRIENVGMDADQSQWIPEARSSMLNSGSTNYRLWRAHTVLTPSQTSSAADTSSSWRQSGFLSKGSSENLWPTTYTPRKSSATPYSQCSDSAWETVPSTPSADDYDLRPVPDNNSASMQSYNDPQTGIWPHEDDYWRGTTYRPTMNMRHNNSVNSAIRHTLPQVLQEVIANADAATTFDLESHSYGGALVVGGALGVDGRVEMAAPSLSMPSTNGGSVPVFSQPPFNGQPRALIAINDIMNPIALPAQQSSAVERSFLPSGINQNSALKAATRIVLDEPTFSTTNLQSPMLIDPPASDLPQSRSTASSITSVVKCTYRGCRAEFRGVSRKDSLRRHWLVKHNPNKQRPVCPECDLIFKSGRRDNLKRHMMEKHPDHPLLASLNVRGQKAVSNKAVTRKSSKVKRARQHA